MWEAGEEKKNTKPKKKDCRKMVENYFEMGDEDDLLTVPHLKTKLRNNSGELQAKKGTAGPGKGKQTSAQGGSESGCCLEEDSEDED